MFYLYIEDHFDKKKAKRIILTRGQQNLRFPRRKANLVSTLELGEDGTLPPLLFLFTDSTEVTLRTPFLHLMLLGGGQTLN
jgi:hypothetical protein